MELPEPQLRRDFRLCDATFSATLWGKPHNYSTQQDAVAESACMARIGLALQHVGAGRTYAPSPPYFTADIVEREQLRDLKKAWQHVLHRNPNAPGEGTLLSAGEAIIFRAAGCATIIFQRPGFDTVVVHAGRDSLIDRQLISAPRGALGRTHESICYTALERLHIDSYQVARKLRVRVFWAIPGPLFPHSFEHAEHGKYNRAMFVHIARKWGLDCVPFQEGAFCLDIPRLVQAQLVQRGIPKENIDLTDAYLGGDVHFDGAEGKPRNLVVVARHT